MIDKEKVLEHGHTLANQIKAHDNGLDILAMQCYNKGFAACLELLWPVVEKYKRGKNYDRETMIEFIELALSDLEARVGK